MRMSPRTILRTALVVVGLPAAAAGCGGGSDDTGPPARKLEPARVGAPIAVGGDPVAVAVGAGAIWVVDASRQLLIKVDPSTRAVVGAPRRVAGGPFAVAVGEGAVWVAAGDGSVRAYDPRTVRPSGPKATVAGANGLAVGDGGVWVSRRRAGTVTRIDARTRRAGAPIRVGRGPADVAVGLGSVWVANADGATVSRIDSRGGRAATPIAVGARQVLAVTVGEGRVWVARAGGQNADRPELVQIDPDAGKVVGKPIAVPGAVPLDLVAGDGLWATDSGGAFAAGTGDQGGVTRVDPATGAVAGPELRTGDRPSAIALGEGGVWVVNEGSGTLTPIAVGDGRSG